MSQETFDRVQVKFEKRRTATAPRKARQYVLSGLVKCGDCGGAMGGIRPSSGAIYRCRLYHQTGRAQCYCNSIREDRLLVVLVAKIRERYTSEEALERLREALKADQESGRPRPRDLTRLRQEIEGVERKIGNAEDVTLEAPPALRPGLYRKLEDLVATRDRLKAELEATTQAETRSERRTDSDIEQAIGVLREIGEALTAAPPEEVKALLASMVSRIELQFDHRAGKTGRTVNTFREGEIFVRPDLGGGWGSDPRSTHLITTGPLFDAELADRQNAAVRVRQETKVS